MLTYSPWLAIRRWLSHRKTIRILAELDDHMLRDIGIERTRLAYARSKRPY